MKNLANCTPTEFLRQTVLLRPVMREWFDKTGFAEIRKRRPEGFDQMNKAERAEAISEQAAENMSDMLDAAMEKDPEGTLKVLALCCFVPPEEVDSHPMTEYLGAFFDMISNEAVRSFFMLFLSQKRGTSSRG